MSDLVVLKLADKGFDVREVIGLSLNDAKHGVKVSIYYLVLIRCWFASGWASLLNGLMCWKMKSVALTHIRDFQLMNKYNLSCRMHLPKGLL